MSTIARALAFRSPFLSERSSVALIRVLAVVGVWSLVILQVFGQTLDFWNFRFIAYFSAGIVAFCAAIRGSRALARTPIDLVFVLWLVLAVASQLYASMALFRVLFMQDLLKYLVIILTTWLVYRAAFAMASVDPVTTGGAFIKAIVVCLGLACLIGIAQGYGPGPIKNWAIEFAQKYGSYGAAVEGALELRSPRPVALFSGPNFYGFLNLVGMALVIGMTVTRGKTISLKRVLLAGASLFVFLCGTVVAQSRFAILTSVLLFALFVYLLFRNGRRDLAIVGVVSIALMAAGAVYIVQANELLHLQNTFVHKLSEDTSFRNRQDRIESLIDMAPDIAPLGAGWTSEGYSTDITGDRWAKTNSIDNGFLQAFVNHGVPGLLHFVFLLGACWWAVRIARPYPWLHIRQLRLAAALLLITYAVYSLSGVRHAKLDSSTYWMMIFGALYGAVYVERWFGPPLGVPARAASGAEPEPAAA